jgi:5,6-dimethylbenzimidazole synthase
VRPEPPGDLFEGLATLVRWRRDVRRFERKPIATELLMQIGALADAAPSVGLSQPWRVIQVESVEGRKKVEQSFVACNAQALEGYQGAERQHYAKLKLAGFDEAPVQLAVFADTSTGQGRGLGKQTMPEMLHYSCVCMIQVLWLAAQSKGLGLGWVSIIDPKVVSEVLHVPKSWQLVAYLLLGYPSIESEIPELERAGWETRSASSSRWTVKK